MTGHRGRGEVGQYRCRSGWTLRAAVLLLPLLAVPALLFQVGADTIRRAAGSDPVTTASGAVTLGLALAIGAATLATIYRFARVDLTWNSQGMTCRGRGTRVSATWSELRDPGVEIPYVDSRGGPARFSLRRWGSGRRLTLRKDGRSVDILEIFFPHFDQLLDLLEHQRVRMNYW